MSKLRFCRECQKGLVSKFARSDRPVPHPRLCAECDKKLLPRGDPMRSSMGLRVAGREGRMRRDLDRERRRDFDRERRIKRQVWITYLLVAVTVAVAVGLTVGHLQQSIVAHLAHLVR